jgi:hypothetical protein
MHALSRSPAPRNSGVSELPTLDVYQKILDAVWRPEIGDDVFEDVVYSRLAAIAAGLTKNKKTYNMS